LSDLRLVDRLALAIRNPAGRVSASLLDAKGSGTKDKVTHSRMNRPELLSVAYLLMVSNMIV